MSENLNQRRFTFSRTSTTSTGDKTSTDQKAQQTQQQQNESSKQPQRSLLGSSTLAEKSRTLTNQSERTPLAEVANPGTTNQAAVQGDKSNKKRSFSEISQIPDSKGYDAQKAQEDRLSNQLTGKKTVADFFNMDDIAEDEQETKRLLSEKEKVQPPNSTPKIVLNAFPYWNPQKYKGNPRSQQIMQQAAQQPSLRNSMPVTNLMNRSFSTMSTGNYDYQPSNPQKNQAQPRDIILSNEQEKMIFGDPETSAFEDYDLMIDVLKILICSYQYNKASQPLTDNYKNVIILNTLLDANRNPGPLVFEQSEMMGQQDRDGDDDDGQRFGLKYRSNP